MVTQGDNPIKDSENDVLNRTSSAHAFARHVLQLDSSEGLVFGVLGAWGSGKTSFINLARPEFEKMSVTVLDFNPWMFSGANHLVDSFFTELSSQLKVRRDLADVGKRLEEYGEIFSGMAWIPVVGSWIERVRGVNKILSQILQRRKEGVGGSSARVTEALRKLEKPIVVVIDDIDRLSTSEIRDIFKLVRLTASFPNIIYVLAFDRARVEEALSEQGMPGRSYLEKILQIAVDLPAVPENVLTTEILSVIDDALKGIENPGPFDDQTWPDIFMEIIRPLIRNMRDVRRYTSAISGTVQELKGQIALADVLALEAVRVFLPVVFQNLASIADELTQTSDRSSLRHNEAGLKEKIVNLVTLAEDQKHIVEALIERLFPAALRHIRNNSYGSEWKSIWLKKRRVAHEDILRLYLERVPGAQLRAFTEAEHAWALLSDEDALEKYLRSVDREHLQDVIASLEAYEDEFAPEHIIPGTTVILNLLPDLPNRPRGMLGLDTSWIISRVIYRLLRTQKDASALEDAVRAILPNLTTLSSKLNLLNIVGYREHVGHKLISEDAASELEKHWRDEVRANLATADFSKEYDLLRVFYSVQREAGSTEGSLTVPDTPSLTLALLRSAKSEDIGQAFGSRAVQRTPRLAWKILVEIFGDEATLGEQIRKLEASAPSDSGDILELAHRYLDGWRPERDFKD